MAGGLFGGDAKQTAAWPHGQNTDRQAAIVNLVREAHAAHGGSLATDSHPLHAVILAWPPIERGLL
jgi:hypothetical protein